jgi:hypothetical protein
MKLKQILFSLFAITLLSFGGWLTILMNIDPAKADTFTFVVFYLSIFCFIMGISSFIGFGVRILLSNREVIYSHIIPSVRQGFLLGLTVAGLLFLQSLRVLSPVDAGAFILAICLLELFFQAKPKTAQQEPS